MAILYRSRPTVEQKQEVSHLLITCVCSVQLSQPVSSSLSYDLEQKPLDLDGAFIGPVLLLSETAMLSL